MKILLIAGPGTPATRVGRGLLDQGHGVEAYAGTVPGALAEALSERVGAVVYLAASRGNRTGIEPDLDDASAVFEALASAGPRPVVVVSSAAVHEPSAHHPQRIDESRRAPRRTGNPIPDAWQALEQLATGWLAEGPLTLLRPTPTLAPGGVDFWSRRVRRPIALTAPGYDPTVQLLDVDDLARAVGATLGRPPGVGEPAIYHVAPAAPVSLAAALRRARTVRLPVPLTLQAPIRALLARVRRAAPIHQMDWTRHPSTVSDRKIRAELGFEPRHSSLGAIDRCRAPGAEPAPDPDPGPDLFGLDRAYYRRLSSTLFRFLQRVWWRIDYRGLGHIPERGPAVLAGVHRGFQPWDGVMAMDQIARRHGRFMRFLVHPSLVKPPVLAPYMQKLGGVPACRANAEWVLDGGGLLGIFPEGIRGAFRRYGPDIYSLGKFGRDEYVRFAIRSGAPIVPFVTVGSAEIFPILGGIDWPWWRRVVEWPYFPITPTMGTVPLPSRWHTRFLEPVPTAHLEPSAAEDKEVVRALSAVVKARMGDALKDLLARRRHRFWGALAESPDGAPEAGR